MFKKILILLFLLFSYNISYGANTNINYNSIDFDNPYNTFNIDFNYLGNSYHYDLPQGFDLVSFHSRLTYDNNVNSNLPLFAIFNVVDTTGNSDLHRTISLFIDNNGDLQTYLSNGGLELTSRNANYRVKGDDKNAILYNGLPTTLNNCVFDKYAQFTCYSSTNSSIEDYNKNMIYIGSGDTFELGNKKYSQLNFIKENYDYNSSYAENGVITGYKDFSLDYQKKIGYLSNNNDYVLIHKDGSFGAYRDGYLKGITNGVPNKVFIYYNQNPNNLLYESYRIYFEDDFYPGKSQILNTSSNLYVIGPPPVHSFAEFLDIKDSNPIEICFDQDLSNGTSYTTYMNVLQEDSTFNQVQNGNCDSILGSNTKLQIGEYYFEGSINNIPIPIIENPDIINYGTGTIFEGNTLIISDIETNIEVNIKLRTYYPLGYQEYNKEQTEYCGGGNCGNYYQYIDFTGSTFTSNYSIYRNDNGQLLYNSPILNELGEIVENVGGEIEFTSSGSDLQDITIVGQDFSTLGCPVELSEIGTFTIDVGFTTFSPLGSFDCLFSVVIKNLRPVDGETFNNIIDLNNLGINRVDITPYINIEEANFKGLKLGDILLMFIIGMLIINTIKRKKYD